MISTVDFIDQDAEETHEWLAALDSVCRRVGPEKAQFLLAKCHERLAQHAVAVPKVETAYINSIPLRKQASLPDDGVLAEKLGRLVRWNAMALVVRGGKRSSELGGHIATYASSALLYETGFNYFFRANAPHHPGDLIYFQGHASPGMYARAFLEGRISEDQMEHFRQEVGGKGISSYPHPWLMPNFWQFPTVSMGLGPIMAIFQARFLKYLGNRGLKENQDRKVWMFAGDGEMDEPESLGALALAGREKLDNLVFVVNCNLQRLDGPVFLHGRHDALLRLAASLCRQAGGRAALGRERHPLCTDSGSMAGSG